MEAGVGPVLAIGCTSFVWGAPPKAARDGGRPTCPGGGAVKTVVPFETVDRGTQGGIGEARGMVVCHGKT